MVGVYGTSTIVGYLMPNPLYTYILNIYDLIWYSLWHINHRSLCNAKSSLCIYIKYIWFDWVKFYGISTIVGYLMPNPLHICLIYRIWLRQVLWHIKHCSLFNAKSSLHVRIYLIYRIWLGWVGFYGISTIVGYLMPNPFNPYKQLYLKNSV